MSHVIFVQLRVDIKLAIFIVCCYLPAELKKKCTVSCICFISRNLNDICNSEKFPKLCTYNQFKIDFRLENYLLILENHGHQITLSKFRISSHNLRIESGRDETYPKLEPLERLCFFL